MWLWYGNNLFGHHVRNGIYVVAERFDAGAEREIHMQLSKRLRAVAALITADGTLADIGTDHAYLPICLTKEKRIAHAIAMDVNPGPLKRARAHIAQYGLGDVIETRLSDGLAALMPGEADSVVIAGMGGALMTRILEEGKEKFRRSENEEVLLDETDRDKDSRSSESRDMSRGVRELILQPQSEIWLVRGWLDQSGWEIVREDMVCEDGKYYPMMRAERVQEILGDDGSSETKEKKTQANSVSGKMSEMELRFGPVLLRERHPVLREFLLHERELDHHILASLNGQPGEAAVARAEEVRRELRLVEEALRRIPV